MTRMEEALDTPGPADDGVLNDMAPASAAGLMVRRARLLRDLATQGRRAGLSVVCAPDGWGKTALLLQYADECARDRTRGAVRLFDAGSWDMLELTRSLDDAFCELSRCEGSPVILVDNVPPLQEEGVSALRERLRAGRERGIEFVLACRPEHRALLRAMSDAHRIGASALAVRPREYPEWARMFSIAPTVDVYELTQGIPALVVLLQGLDGRDRGGGAQAWGGGAVPVGARGSASGSRAPGAPGLVADSAQGRVGGRSVALWDARARGELGAPGARLSDVRC